MPIPSPVDFRDRTKKHSQVRELLAQMAENVAASDEVDQITTFIDHTAFNIDGFINTTGGVSASSGAIKCTDFIKVIPSVIYKGQSKT